ncbi:MAG: oligosaccharide flippase family protein [Prevotella sp.]|nr:oligosaccharide flippase family protein [Prevotella sp.]
MKKTTKTDSYSHILKYTGLFGGIQGLGILVSIIRNKLVAVILGPQGVGLISLFNTTLKFMSDSTNFGISMSAVKSLSEDFDKGDEQKTLHTIKIIRSLSLLTALIGILLCLLLSPFLSRFTFSWQGHVLHFLCLSPIVGIMAITGGELAILKGVRQLRQLASISVYNMLAALVISTPIYFFFGNKGIIPSLILMALAQMLLTIGCSYRLYPPRFSNKRRVLGEGINMIKLGLAFVLAGILGSGANLLIQSYLSNKAMIDTVGLYSTGYTMTMTYVGLVFSAMETDYFPRLSSFGSLGVAFNQTVNRQIEVMLLLVSPMLVFFMIALPVLLPLFYSGNFMSAIGMTHIVIIAMYFRAWALPVQYIPLARGDSASYLLLEAIYDVLFVVLVIFFFSHFGLTGAGVGIVMATILDLAATLLYARWKYSYTVSMNVSLYMALQLPIGILAYCLTYVQDLTLYWGIGTLLIIVSTMATIIILRSKTHLWEALLRKTREKLHRFYRK